MRLLAEGYQEEALMAEFERRKNKAAEALGSMAEEARQEAQAGKGQPADAMFGELLGEDDV